MGCKLKAAVSRVEERQTATNHSGNYALRKAIRNDGVTMKDLSNETEILSL